jgi:diaminopimelate epimerase
MDSRNSNNLPFMKMHGLGNDFVVIDARERNIELSDKRLYRVLLIDTLVWALIN